MSEGELLPKWPSSTVTGERTKKERDYQRVLPGVVFEKLLCPFNTGDPTVFLTVK